MVGEMVKNRVGQANIFHVIIPAHKEPSHFSMLESKLWHNKTEIKNVKVAKMVEFIKTCDPCRFYFCHFFCPIRLLPFLLGNR